MKNLTDFRKNSGNWIHAWSILVESWRLSLKKFWPNLKNLEAIQGGMFQWIYMCLSVHLRLWTFLFLHKSLTVSGSFKFYSKIPPLIQVAGCVKEKKRHSFNYLIHVCKMSLLFNLQPSFTPCSTAISANGQDVRHFVKIFNNLCSKYGAKLIDFFLKLACSLRYGLDEFACLWYFWTNQCACSV